MPEKSRSFHIETLGCPKNAVDSDKIVATLIADGLVGAGRAEDADLIVVNTCAFIEAARQESIDTVLALSDAKRIDAKLAVTGCMAERYGDELAAALPEVDAIVGFGDAGSIASTVGMVSPVTMKRKPVGVRDLLELPRPTSTSPWAYLKIAEGCDRACAFCAIPTFRGKQRSRTSDSILTEARGLVANGVSELVLVAQDLAWYGRDIGTSGALSPLLRSLDALTAEGLSRIRLLYLYPSEVQDPLVSTMLTLDSVVPYFDLSLQHAAPDLLRRMKRWGNAERFLATIDDIRERQPNAVFRSSFISGFPGETEDHHEQLLRFLEAAQLDWAGFFAYSSEAGTTAAELDGAVDDSVIRERLRELAATQEPITAAARIAIIGSTIEVLVDGVDEDGIAVGRSYREAPEIDGVVRLADADFVRSGAAVVAIVTDVEGPDLDATAQRVAPRSVGG